MGNKTTLRDYMPAHVTEALKGYPTTHENCIRVSGVARSGKTARDRARRKIKD